MNQLVERAARGAPYGPEIWVRGPRAGAAGDGAGPSAGAVAAAEEPARPTAFAWVNAHGGAGASTLSAVLGGADCGNRWPDPAEGESVAVLLVARTHAAGLQALSQALDTFRREKQRQGLAVAAAVLVADAPGRTPRQLAQRIKVIGSVVEVHRVPWIPQWRTGNLDAPLPRELSSLVRLVSGPHQPTGGTQ
ncbi:hypothetical protein DMH02_002050 [Streptomyces sp. WAC 00631]|uniref:hypothetical protein n=1 Tax=Streptomyces sp. WAC 00631 TaxID=2203201 RepID=UPI000F7ABACF|nr:hypothetical protein [Streptomyces sp. WAC 00631]MCC5032075.1 hypothetical protein [Streptomyces sp. WAC 00631]